MLLFKHEATEPRSGKQWLMITGTINSRVRTEPQVLGSLSPHTILCCFLYGKFVQMDCISLVCSVTDTIAIRLINDPENPVRSPSRKKHYKYWYGSVPCAPAIAQEDSEVHR